jgi:class 3 adenylate cyclase
VDPPPTQYVDRDGAALAFQVIGDGPQNTVVHLEIVHHLDLMWTDPHVHRNLEHLAQVSRTVIFQRRGFGLSDPVPYIPTLEQQAEDVLAVMDAAGMDQAHIYGMYSTVGPVAMVAACAPERVSALLLYIPYADGVPLGKGTPAGWTEAEAEDYSKIVNAMLDSWGSGLLARMWSEEGDSSYNRRLMGMLERSSATPAVARAHFEWLSEVDYTEVFRNVQVPTHIVRQETDRIPDAVVQRVADLVDGATYRTLPALERGASLGEGMAGVVAYFVDVMAGADERKETHRSLGTVLFTDIVGSTELLARLGDDGYADVRDAHERQVRLAVENADGRMLKSLGDGTLSIFDGLSRAVRCADEIRKEGSDLGIEVRAGLHIGEVDRAGTEVAGMTVHIAARVCAAAAPGEVLVSRTVRAILVGSGLDFIDHGEHELKGVPGRWQLYALADVRDGEAVELEPSMQTMGDKAAVAAARRVPGAMRSMARLGNAMQRRRAQRA